MSEKRTLTQNASIHVFCRLLAEALNDAGLDMKKALKPEIDIPWTEESAKNHLWKPIQDAMLDKDSTTELTTTEVSDVYNVLNRHLSDRFGLSVTFPNRHGG